MPRIAKGRKHKVKTKQRRTPERAASAASGRRPARGTGELFERLVALQARLRAPGGCPWDREQTHESLRMYLIEEAYEVLDALESGNADKFAGELGDLLLQVVFHAELAAEAGRFNIADVIQRVHDKMVRRHPHVFGTATAATSTQVLKNWEELKREERRAEEKKDGAPGESDRRSTQGLESVLDAVPRTLPALLEAHQMTRRAANVGFDWREVVGILEKLSEEAGELRKAIEAGDRRQVEAEVGDVLFVGVNLARFLGLDAEITLKKANRKFGRRFREMERLAAAAGHSLAKMSPDELESLWNTAKTNTSKQV